MIIIAPHGDDEIIGCSSIVCLPDVSVVYLTEPEFCKTPIWEYQTLSPDELHNFIIDNQHERIYVPDPFHEYHPLHKAAGGLMYYLSYSRKIDVVYYTTRMNVNYVKELNEYQIKNKRELLEWYYHNKSDLWKYDWRYFLFEGYTTY